jgi:2'-5' RNA ligase
MDLADGRVRAEVRKIEIAYTEFTLWLIPREPLRSTLRSIVRRLAASLDAVEFEPHVTVFCAHSTDAEARAVARLIAEQFSPIELSADRLDHSENYTKTLFVQFRESAVLRHMFETATGAYSQRSDYVLNPHLSLLYKKLSGSKQKELCKTLDVPMGAYGFDRIRMIEAELPIEDAGPVRRWRMVCDAPLAEP